MHLRLLAFATVTATLALPGRAAENLAASARSVLAEHCFDCHGPDKKQRKGDLRLDTFAGATKDLGGYRAVVPGKPAESEALALILTDDEDDRMPPAKTGKRLGPADTETLRRWIAAGAPYPTHWAYRPVEKPTPPKLAEGAKNLHPIDPFVRAKLEQAKVSPSPEADRRTLAKRLHYDLLGLPPAPERVEAFLADKSPDAYSKLVDELLASPHFGERWGRHWLDKARYADSDGYEKDRPRPNAWRYRDWVIQAINDDLPFDQFTLRQIAGDLLPDATPEHRLATAFHRQTLTNTEGGADREQWRVAAVMDRVETTGAVWLGLTLACARCHDHKYDALSQDEYYQLFAFYNNGDETNFNVPGSPSAVANHQKAKAAHDKLLRELETRLKNLQAAREGAQADWEKETRSRLAKAKPTSRHPLAFENLPDSDDLRIAPRPDGSLFVEKLAADSATYVLHATLDLKDEPLTGFRLETLADPKLPAKGPGLTSHGNFVLNEFRAFAADLVDADKRAPLPLVSAKADFSQNNWPASAAIDGKAETGWAIAPQMGRPHHVTLRLAKPLPAKDAARLRLELAQTYGTKHLVGRFRILALTGEDDDSLPPENVRKALLADAAKRTSAQRKLLADHFAATDSSLAKLRKEIDDHRKKAPKLPTLSVRVITQRASSPRPTHVFRRGEFKQPLHQVQPGAPSTLPAIRPRDEGKPADRLDLARWLVQPDNPLTPRVLANQVWSHLFGHGLVRTPEDFGVRGEAPTHPALLDHLAHHLVHQARWSRKALIRHVLHSATYKQSSRHRPELREVDPANRLLHRQNRFRVEAEIIRDLSLGIAGALSPKVGGPSVFPPLPPGVAALSYANNFKWATSRGEDALRRGLYTFFKRTSPHPNLITFDCPDSNVACVQRRRSNTPLAALVTLNNATFSQAARDFAQRLRKELPQADDEARLARGFQLATARPPEPTETQALAQLLKDARAHYAANPEQAKTYAGDPETAAWTATTRVLLNLDEFLTRE